MVNLGLIHHDKPIPSPDLSFVRDFNDESVGWQFRGQYVMWTGRSTDEQAPYRLLERVGDRVARMEYASDRPIFHKIAANKSFLIETLMGCWFAFDSDAMWVDTPGFKGRYAVLAVGGIANKPARAVVDWPCPQCGTALAAKEMAISPPAFQKFLADANAWVEAFNQDEALRTCGSCGAVHPPSQGVDQRHATSNGGQP